MAHSCPHCHHTFRNGRVFCPNCGALVSGKKSEPKTLTPPSPTSLSWKKLWQREEKASYVFHALHLSAFAVGIVLVLSLCIWLLWHFAAAKTPLAAFLPRKQTVLAIEGDMNPYNRQFRGWDKLFSNTAASLNLDRIRIEVNALISSLGADYDKLFDTHAGYALIEYAPAKYAHVFAMKIRDKKALAGVTSLPIGTRTYASFIEDDYFFLISDAQIKPLLGEELADRLIESETYQSLNDELHPYGVLHMYAQPTALYNAVLTMNQIPWMYDIRYTLIASVLAQSTAILTDVRVEHDSLVAHTVTAYAHEGQLPVTAESSIDLLFAVEESDTIALMGSNFGHNIATIQDSLDLTVQSVGVPFTILLQQITETASVPIDQIEALLNGPYLIAFGASPSDVRAVLAMDQTDATTLLGHLRSGLVAYAPTLSPKRVTVRLRDGTTAEELVINPTATVLERQETLVGRDISIMEIPDSVYRIAYTYQDGFLYLARDAQKLAEALNTPAPIRVTDYRAYRRNGQLTIIQVNTLEGIIAKKIAEAEADPILNPWNTLLRKLYPYLIQFQIIIDESIYTWDRATHITTLYR